MNDRTERDAVIADLYQAGETMQSIADSLGCCRNTIGRALRRKGIAGRKPTSGPRFPLAPLEARLGNPTAREFGLRVGAGRDTVQKWRERGLSFWQADTVATQFGMRADEVWPDWGAS